MDINADQFSSDNYLGFTNMMGLLQEGMDNVYYDGAPFVRYNRQELTPATATVTFDFQKYGIDLRGDDTAVYFPLATISDIYSDLYYHVAGYNGEKVIVITENQKSEIAKLEPERSLALLKTPSRSADMAAYSYGELCFVVDHFYDMPGRSPFESIIMSEGLDKAIDQVDNGATIKQLLKSTSMPEYILGLDCLQSVLNDGGHTLTVADLLIYKALEEYEDQGLEVWMSVLESWESQYPELVEMIKETMMGMGKPQEEIIGDIRPFEGTYYKEGDTAYLMLGGFGPTNNAAWKAYYQGGCTGPTPAIDEVFPNDMSVVLDALKQADEDPEVKNLVIDLATNHGGSLDVVLAMTALMGGQSHMYCENILTGQRQIVYYDVDCNFDGKFDELDKEVKYDLNFAVLTSGVAFSCGNLFPSLMKDMGFPIIGEKSGGGACAIQNFITPEGLQYQLSSARARLTDKNWQNIDSGVEPTFVIDTSTFDYSSFYDVPYISSLISQATNITVPPIYSDSSVAKATQGKWYTLDGRCLQAQPTEKGIFIHNGRKVRQ